MTILLPVLSIVGLIYAVGLTAHDLLTTPMSPQGGTIDTMTTIPTHPGPEG
jgi:hypothetical protein